MKKQIAIIGAGPAAMALACFLDSSKFEVTIYEKNKTAGRKFLVAGKGGFNLSYAEPMQTFVRKYAPDDFLVKALLAFTNEDLRSWLSDIGIPTFIGSSQRVYPEKNIKPIGVLKAILDELKRKGVNIQYQKKWLGWTAQNELSFKDLKTGQAESQKPDHTIFALGGASWKVTGSDGDWADLFIQKGISIKPFQAVNCAFEVDWPSAFLKQYEGKPLKNLAIYCNGKKQIGEAVITKFGLEGNAIYGLSLEIVKALLENKDCQIYLDLKLMVSAENLAKKLTHSKEKKRTEQLRKTLNLNKTKIALLKAMSTKEDFLENKTLVQLIKNLPVTLTGSAPIDEAISTIGGIPTNALSENFELNQMKNTYCIGEMVEWYAPTGGYLLQGCFSMGVYLAKYLNNQAR